MRPTVNTYHYNRQSINRPVAEETNNLPTIIYH